MEEIIKSTISRLQDLPGISGRPFFIGFHFKQLNVALINIPAILTKIYRCYEALQIRICDLDG